MQAAGPTTSGARREVAGYQSFAMGGEGPGLFVAHGDPLDPAFGNVVRDHVESITDNAVTMLHARALQRLNDDLCDLLAHGSEPLSYQSGNMRLATESGL